MHTRLLATFSIGIFSASLLLFMIQPLFSKMVLPQLGGAPAVWTTLMLFFQISLLLGYAYTHFSTKLLGVKKQSLVHLVFLGLSLVFLPLDALEKMSAPLDDTSPTFWALKLAALSIGVPFILLSANAPLMQAWFVKSDHTKNETPYFLYAVSNAGSLIALLSYPFMIQPLINLEMQARLWSIAYVVFIGLCAISVYMLHKRYEKNERVVETKDVHITFTTKLSWIILSAVPSSLLLGTTNYMSTDIAASPLLWVIPLALYLLTFINAFASKPLLNLNFSAKAAILFSLFVVVSIFWRAAPLFATIIAHLGAMFFLAMSCHFRLASITPHASKVTTFYLYMAFGGALGGVFNALVAPYLFNTTYEYAIAFGLSILLLTHMHEKNTENTLKSIVKDIFLALLAIIAITSIKINLYIDDVQVFYIPHLNADERTLYQILFTFFFFMLSKHRPVRLATGFTGIWLMLLIFPQLQPNHEYMKRSFFGVYAVRYNEPEYSFEMWSGNFLSKQGAQSLLPEQRLKTTSFYPLEKVKESLPQALMNKPMGVIGLGVGTLACLGPKEVEFFEIDPLVEEIAKDNNFFTFLSDCDSTSKVILGDGRIEMRKVEDGRYGILVLDAFNSLSIPTHLLTKQAFERYMSKMDPHGVMLVNITNSSLDLKPVVEQNAKKQGLHVLERQTGKADGSVWLALAHDIADFGTLHQTDEWQPLPPQQNIKLWTDSYSNILPLIKWGL